ncbi:hypothetical protein niasHS_014796 [Heterodera schachtii]|uniref:Uncharacterized protein n=1 Tax=Heterodera schachtii TaxID=97005 RepID=A0ABD2IFX0_HETSC
MKRRIIILQDPSFLHKSPRLREMLRLSPVQMQIDGHSFVLCFSSFVPSLSPPLIPQMCPFRFILIRIFLPLSSLHFSSLSPLSLSVHRPLHPPAMPSSENSPAGFSRFDFLPQCTNNLVLNSEVRTEMDLLTNEDIKRVNISSFVQLTTITLGETHCMLISGNNSANEQGREAEAHDEQQQHFSLLHIVEYVGLELHYAIKSTYKFAIPSITPRCKCDCAGGETICSVEKYQYRNCSISDGVCYRTHKGSQPNGGCLSSGKAEICCQVELKPYKKWTFQSVQLKQPSIVFILRYRIFERNANEAKGEGQWEQSVDERIAIPLNKGSTKFELNARDKTADDRSEHRVEISAVGGTPQRKMEPGMYFYKIEDPEADADSKHRLRDGVPLNWPGESNLEKLGWFRWEKGHGWAVRKGLEKITQAQHISVEDCKSQRYRATFNAEQFVLRRHSSAEEVPTPKGANGEEEAEGTAEEMGNFDLGNLVEEEPWAGVVRTSEREVVLEHAEGVALTLTLRTESWPRIVHHSSQLSDFSGSIVLDRESNLFLNLTFFNARGTLIGQIFSSQDSLSVMESIFSIDISKSTQSKAQRAVATSVRSPRLVCFYPMGSIEKRKCHRLDFVRQPLQENPPMTDHWQRQRSECQGCNERGVESFLSSLDPRQWLDGLNSPAELFTCLVELVLCLVLLLLAVLLLTKCVFPLCRCVRFVVRPAKCKKYTGNREDRD